MLGLRHQKRIEICVCLCMRESTSAGIRQIKISPNFDFSTSRTIRRYTVWDHPPHYNLVGVGLPPLVVCTLMILYFECFTSFQCQNAEFSPYQIQIWEV